MPNLIERIREWRNPEIKKAREALVQHRRCLEEHEVYAPPNATDITVLVLDNGRYDIGYLTQSRDDRRPIRTQGWLEPDKAQRLIDCGVPQRRVEGEMKI